MPRLGSRVRVPFSALFYRLKEKENPNYSMNFYLRYFDREVLVDNVDDAIAFLADIEDIEMNPMLETDIRSYCASDVYYPKRYKIRPRVYFIIIKTEAPTMLDFKEKRAVHPVIDRVEKPMTPAMVGVPASKRIGRSFK